MWQWRPFITFGAVRQSDCAPNHKSSVDGELRVIVANPFALSDGIKIKTWTLQIASPHPNLCSRSLTMPSTSTLPFLPAVFRKKRGPMQPSRSLSADSSESIDASIRPYVLEGPLITPGGTPGWASQPWHYVFQVSAFQR
jgi:hypothetical protein